MSEDNGNVTPITMRCASQAKLAWKNKLEIEGGEKLETFVAIEFFSDDSPVITHNTASIERLLYAAEVIRQYALGAVSSTPESEAS